MLNQFDCTPLFTRVDETFVSDVQDAVARSRMDNPPPVGGEIDIDDVIKFKEELLKSEYTDGTNEKLYRRAVRVATFALRIATENNPEVGYICPRIFDHHHFSRPLLMLGPYSVENISHWYACKRSKLDDSKDVGPLCVLEIHDPYGHYRGSGPPVAIPPVTNGPYRDKPSAIQGATSADNNGPSHVAIRIGMRED